MEFPVSQISVSQIMGKLGAALQTYPIQLALGLLILVIATSLGMSIAAYRLTRIQLDHQVAIHLTDVQQATLSLLETEQRRLGNLALLFAERPTLASLRSANDEAALARYMADFQQQIDIDLLLLCDLDGGILAGAPASLERGEHCPAGEGFLWVDGQPALVVRRSLSQGGAAQAAPIVVAGIWLDEQLMHQLVAGTGVEQVILNRDGQRLASSIPLDDTATRQPLSAAQLTAARPELLTLSNRTYYRRVTPLGDSDSQAPFYSEILFPAEALLAARSRILTVLVTSTVAIALLVAAIGAWSIRRITAPLAQLTLRAEAISQGDLSGVIQQMSGPREVRTLAAALRRSQERVNEMLAELEAAHDRLDNLLQSLDEGVVILDADGCIRFWNQGAAQITGWPSEQALGKQVDVVLPLVDDPAHSLADRLHAPGQRVRGAVFISGGRTAILEITRVRDLQALSEAGGSNHGAQAMVLRDVTEEEAMQHLRAYFLANISHEFRTPLSTLNASIELLMDNDQEITGSEMRTLLKPIHLSLLELQTLIDNLLEGSTIEAGQFRLRPRPMLLNEAIVAALTLVQPMLERRQQPLSVTQPAVLHPIVADRSRITQVLINLMANASKYTPIGEPIDVIVEAVPDGGYRVAVADRGPGIPLEERRNLFRRFVRLEGMSSAQQGQVGDSHGTGIGLYIVKTVVEAHGGQVGIDDRPGGGSIFWFKLPPGERAPAQETV